MAIDPSIALGVKPLEIANPLAQYGQVAQLQNMQTQNQLHQMQMREAEATAQERNALRQLNPSASDYEAQLFKVNPQLGIAYRKEANTAAAQEAARQKSLIEAAAAKQGMMSQAYRDISSRPSDANIMAHTEDIQASPLFSEAEKQKALATQQTLLAMPLTERGAYLASQGAKSSDLKPQMVTENLGGTSRVSAIPAFGGAPAVLSTATKTATPGEIMANNIAQQRANYEGQRVGLEGQRVSLAQQELDRKVAGGELKPVPVHAQKAITGAAASIGQLSDAIDLLKGLEVSGQKGSKNATGLKAYAPDIALNRLDPAGTVTRAAIADIGSMIMHDRSGAAVTVSESPRLKPFIPLNTDDAATALKKLERLRKIQLDDSEALTSTYNPDQGFKSFKTPIRGGAGKSAAPTIAPPSGFTPD